MISAIARMQLSLKSLCPKKSSPLVFKKGEKQECTIHMQQDRKISNKIYDLIQKRINNT
jgi:hypothetical protein